VVYVASGQLGFYGDRIFVVLSDQAALSEAAALPDLAARREAVYTTLVNHADATQADLRAALERFGIGYRPYYLVNGLEVEGGLLVRLWLETRSDVAQLMVSPRLRPAEPLSLPLGEPLTAPKEPEWNLTELGADRVWHELGITGEGVVIGQSDSGVQGDHPEFATRYRGRSSGDDYNWFDPWLHSSAPNDQDGHGTHTLGSVLGDSVGVAPGATWFACANLVRNLGNAALYLDCMQFMLAPFPLDGDPLSDGDPSRAADVLNNSWGCPTHVEGCTPEVYTEAMAALEAAGIFVVASAGNDGPLCTTVSASPAIYEQALSVGAVDETGDLANFSSAGPVTVDGSGRIKPDILAPGVDILSAWPGGGYQRASGTSMAGPHVAGVVALIWSANPALRGDIERTRAILQETARPFHGGLEDTSPLAENPVSDQIDGAGGPLAEWLGLEMDRSCLAQTDLTIIPNFPTMWLVMVWWTLMPLCRRRLLSSSLAHRSGGRNSVWLRVKGSREKPHPNPPQLGEGTVVS
jgi:subtilisin family serine protease